MLMLHQSEQSNCLCNSLHSAAAASRHFIFSMKHGVLRELIQYWVLIVWFISIALIVNHFCFSLLQSIEYFFYDPNDYVALLQPLFAISSLRSINNKVVPSTFLTCASSPSYNEWPSICIFPFVETNCASFSQRTHMLHGLGLLYS